MARARRGLLNNFTKKIEERSTRRSGDPQIFPVRSMDYNSSARIRLVPAIDPLTVLPFTELKMIPMSFVDETDDSKQVLFRAPSREMYSVEPFCCKVLQPVRDLWRDYNKLKEDGAPKTDVDRVKALASAHWLDIAYFWQGFVQDAKIKDFEVPENPLMVFRFTKQIHNILDKSMFKNQEDPFDYSPIGEFLESDIESLRTENIPEDMSEEEFMDLFLGYDFIIRKEKKDDYPNYEQSGWALKSGETSLNEDQLGALMEHGFHDVRKKYLPPQPTEAQYEVMEEMINVSIDGGEWNPEWEEVDKDHDFKIRGFRKNGDKSGSSGKSTSFGTRGKSDDGSGSKRTNNADKLKNLTRRKTNEDEVKEPAGEEPVDEPIDDDDEGGEEEVAPKTTRGRGRAKPKSDPEPEDADDGDDGDDGKTNASKNISAITAKIRARKQNK